MIVAKIYPEPGKGGRGAIIESKRATQLSDLNISRDQS
jgi:hypothetical protein